MRPPRPVDGKWRTLKPIHKHYIKLSITECHEYALQDEAGSLFEPNVPEIAGASNSALLDRLGDSGNADNPQLAATGGGSFK